MAFDKPVNPILIVEVASPTRFPANEKNAVSKLCVADPILLLASSNCVKPVVKLSA
jgi:hypothetical protein